MRPALAALKRTAGAYPSSGGPAAPRPCCAESRSQEEQRHDVCPRIAAQQTQRALDQEAPSSLDYSWSVVRAL